MVLTNRRRDYENRLHWLRPSGKGHGREVDLRRAGIDRLESNPGKATVLGVPVAESPARLVQKVDTLILNLFDSRAVKSVFFKKDGLIQGGLTGKTLIDTSTNHGEEVLFFTIF